MVATKPKSKLPAMRSTARKVKPTSAATDGILTLAEAAKLLRVPDETVRSLAVSGALPGRKLGDDWRFLDQALRDWLASSEPRKEDWREANQRMLATIGTSNDPDDLKYMLDFTERERRNNTAGGS